MAQKRKIVYYVDDVMMCEERGGLNEPTNTGNGNIGGMHSRHAEFFRGCSCVFRIGGMDRIWAK